MTITYNDNSYETTIESIYRDFSIYVNSLEEACELVNAFDGMSDYTFGEVSYTNMVVIKRSIIIETRIKVKVMLRQKTEAELAKEELVSLRTAMSELAGTVSKTNAAKINKVLSSIGGEDV